MGLERDNADYVWTPRLTRTTAVPPAVRSLRRSASRAPVPTDSQATRRADVWRHMQQRGVAQHKRRTYAAARIKYGMQGLLPETLPAGYTWVEPHERGATGAFSAIDPGVDDGDTESLAAEDSATEGRFTSSVTRGDAD